MNIPNSVIYVVGDVLGNWYYSHTQLNTLFGSCGFLGAPPDGNCVQKCQAWLRRANDAADTNPIELLGSVLVEFMNLDRQHELSWQQGMQRVRDILAKNELAFEPNGNIIPTSTVKSIKPAQTVPTTQPADTNTAQPSLHTPSACPVIVLVTVTDNESHALLDAFVGKGQPPVQVTSGGLTYGDLGIHGGYRIVHTVCEMGAGGVGASQQRTGEAITHWQPMAIIAVGIAFGLDETKQAIGDVLVSTQIQDYELGRLNEDGTLTPRGDKPSSADILRNRLRQTDITETRRSTDWPKVRFGLVLTGQKLVDNLDYRESLKTIFTEAIGGEMEGIGLYVSASAAKVDWIIVKAICDWGHKKNLADKDAWQKIAATNAARVVKTALDGGGLYGSESIRPVSAPQSISRATSSNQAALTLWQKKLAFLQTEEVVSVDATHKFSIQQRIEEAQTKIQEFGG